MSFYFQIPTDSIAEVIKQLEKVGVITASKWNENKYLSSTCWFFSVEEQAYSFSFFPNQHQTGRLRIKRFKSMTLIQRDNFLEIWSKLSTNPDFFKPTDKPAQVQDLRGGAKKQITDSPTSPSLPKQKQSNSLASLAGSIVEIGSPKILSAAKSFSFDKQRI